jgi:hypothetical protein
MSAGGAERARDGGTLKLFAFWLFHLALVAAAITFYGHRASQLADRPVLPALRPAPLVVAPLYDDPAVISDEQLARLLAKIRLRFGGSNTPLGAVDHGLRFSGPTAEFEDADMMDGEDLLRLLVDHRRFAEVYGQRERPLLIPTAAGGVEVRALQGPASASHVDHTIASLAEIGTPLDFPIVTPGGGSTYRAMVEESLRGFSLNQPEYEWSALTYALLARPTPGWTTGEGQEMTFDRLAARLRREALPRGVCSANHRLHALVTMLRVDESEQSLGEPRLLSGEERERIVEYLQGITARFVEHQHPDGFWNGDWPTSAPATSEPSDRETDTLAIRIIVTGHVLEWWALAPELLHPPRQVVVDAAQWLVGTVDGLDPQQVQSYYSYLSHVGRALSLWRGRTSEGLG